MDNKKYLDDLQAIKDIMSRTSQFISLSGLSGISTGIIALVGVFMANYLIFKNQQFLTYNPVEIPTAAIINLMLIASITLFLSIGSALFFTNRKTKSKNENVWDLQAKRLLFNLLLPLFTGGLFCLMLLSKGFIGMLPSVSLIFYGLALVNGSKYTLEEIRTLGIIQIVLGLLAFHFIEYSLWFWGFGFGVVQIIYGLIIQRKY